MRKLPTKNKPMTLYIPNELFERLETYMLNHYGRTYGKNEVVNAAISQYVGDERTEVNSANAHNPTLG